MKNIIETGLSNQEVQEQILAGNVNVYDKKTTKTNRQIIQQNVFTLFNLLNFILAAALIIVGSYTNAFFILIIITNITIGIVQEIRARNMVEKLSILAKDRVSVRRDSKDILLDSEELVLNDIVILKAGEQIPSDMIVVEGCGEVNESLLTGETDAIEKANGERLLSGSFMTSGQLIGQVEHVGAENYANKLVDEAKVTKVISSELLGAINKVSKFTSLVIVPLGILLFIEAFLLRQSSANLAVTSSVAALIGMLPKGLALLISIALAAAVIKLAQQKILVQNMYAVENFAQLDVICLDKTGTLTEGEMKVEDIYVLNDNYQDNITQIVKSYLFQITDNNQTMRALRNYFGQEATFLATDYFPFSSERKWGAVELADIGSLYLGSPENLFSHEEMSSMLYEFQSQGLRVLALGHSFKRLQEKAPTDLEPIAFITLSDPIREDAKDTLKFLEDRGIALKIISGDNPQTVSAIAKKVGFENYDRFVDLSRCKTDADLEETLKNYSIFGRVTPQQKKKIVSLLKNEGKTVGMTGDGVNDILALREADVSIAMGGGDNATKQISDIVLLESEFSALPKVIFEGQRVINNITCSSSVFFIKTIYSFILTIICLLTNVAFPFIPIQITLVDLAIEGYPAFFTSFEESKKRAEKNFFRVALSRALPSALLVALSFITASSISYLLGFSQAINQSLIYFLLVGISCLAVAKAYSPFNAYRLFLTISMTVGSFLAIFLFHNLLKITLLSGLPLVIFILLLLANIVLYQLIYPFFNYFLLRRRS